MTPARRTFRPPLWATLLTPVVVAACGALGTWQLGRGDAKARLQAQLGDTSAPAAPLTAQGPRAEATIRRVHARGAYEPARTLLHDGQSHAGRPGYHVWTPLRLDGGALVLVNRGWVAAEADAVAPPAGAQSLTGYWRTLPEPGLRLATSNPCPPRPAPPAKVLYPDAAQLACVLGEPVVPGLLLLDAQAEGGFVREWHATGVPPQRHYAYAAQWFALGALAATLYFVLNLKRVPR